MNPAVFFVEPQSESVSDSELKAPFAVSSDADPIVESLRGQLSIAFAPFDSQQGSVAERIATSPEAVETSVGTEVSEGVSRLELADSVLADAPFSVQVVFDWSDGPQQVTVVGLSASDFQITIEGLGETSFAKAGAASAEQLVYQNAVDVLKSLQPHRTLEISFQRPVISDDMLIHFDSQFAEIASPTTVREPQKDRRPGPAPLNSPSRNEKPAVARAGISSTEDVDSAELIDEVFRDEHSVLIDSTLPPETIDRPSGSQSLAGGVSAGRADERAVDSLRAVDSVRTGTPLQGTNSEVSVNAAGPRGRLAAMARRGWNWLRTGKLLLRSATASLTSSVPDFFHSQLLAIGTDGLSQGDLLDGYSTATDWLVWLMNPSPGTPEAIGINQSTSRPDSELLPEAVPFFQEKHSPPRGVRASSLNPPTQARTYRENHRQCTTQDGPQCLAQSESESLLLPGSDSIPRELRYVTKPRGPPVYGRDADVPLAEMEAPADLLERLRYSIAPRGPSLVTVEMQSPDSEFSSGPRVSSEVSRFKQAC